MDREIYEKYWEPNQAWSPSNFPFYPFERKLVERIGAPGDTCLDYGCGDARRYGQILQTMGFDGFTEVKISGSPFTLDFLLTRLPVACAGSRAEQTLRKMLNSLSWLGESFPSLFGRRLLGLAQKSHAPKLS